VAQTYTGPQGPLGDLSYTYDAMGNRIATGGSWARSGIPTATSASGYDAANQQLAFGGVTQTFDANGNLSTQTDSTGTTTYSWDARNRLSSISGPTVSASFQYDALGRRIAKTISGVTTSYQHDGLDIVREIGATGDANYLRSLILDEAIARTNAMGTQVYLADILASTVALSDDNASLATEYTYEPFGQTAVSSVPASTVFQFTGRENDGTRLYYYRARYYDPIPGRFIQEDPLGSLGGINLYAYGANNPLKFLDPLGLQPCEDCPGGEWSSFSFPAFSGFFGGGGTISRTTYRCKTNNLVCEGTSICFGGGPIAAAGIGFDFGGYPKSTAGVSNVPYTRDFGRFSSGIYLTGGPVSVAMTGSSASVGIAKSVGAGVAYVSCLTVDLRCWRE
jgi:RHS repeat-associated protein